MLSPHFRLFHLRWDGSQSHERARTPGQTWLSALLGEKLFGLATFLHLRERPHLDCWRHHAKLSTCHLGNSKGWEEALWVSLCFSILLLHCACTRPAPEERVCLGKVCKTPHFWVNPITFYLSLILTCIAELGGGLQIGINIARIILFWLWMFILQSWLAWPGQKCVTFKGNHAYTHKHACTYIHTYMCNAQNWSLYLVPNTTDAWGQGVFTLVQNHRLSLPSQVVPVDFLPIYPDVTKHCSVT